MRSQRCAGALYCKGHAVLPEIAGSLQVWDRADGACDWSGSFLLPHGTLLAPGEYLLQLDDGRSGNIIIANLSGGKQGLEAVQFIGVGRLEASEPHSQEQNAVPTTQRSFWTRWLPW